MTLRSKYAQRSNSLPVTELMLLVVALVWGTSYGLTKQALVYVPILLFLTIRFAITFVLLLPQLIFDLRTKPLTSASPVVFLGLCLFSIFLSETFGVYHTSATKAAILISSCILLTPMYEWFVFKTKPTNQLFIASAICLFGISLLIGKPDTLSHINIGDIAMIVAAVLRAIMVVQSKRVLVACPLSPLSVTAVQCGTVACGSFIGLICFSNQPIILPTQPIFWMIIGYLVLLATLFSFFAQNYGVKKLGPTKAALLMGTEPLFGTLFAVWYLAEALTLAQWIGAGLILLATTLTLINKKNTIVQ